MDYDIAVLVVTFQNDEDILKKCIDSVLGTNLKIKFDIIDNSATDRIKNVCRNPEINYTFNNANIGYGAGHNIAIKQSLQKKIKYHLVLNPDVYFKRGVLEGLYKFMQDSRDIGLAMPKILCPDGSVQHLCKLLLLDHQLCL